MRSPRDLRGVVLGVRARHGHLIAPAWRVIGMRCGVDRTRAKGRQKTLEAGFMYLENIHTGWREDVPHRVIAGGLADGTLAIVDEVAMGGELRARRVSVVVKRVVGIAAALLVCLAASAFGQSITSVDWTWEEQSRPYLGDLTKMEAMEVVDAGLPEVVSTIVTPTCDPVALWCSWVLSPAAQARLAVPGRHIIQASFRSDPLHLWSFLTGAGIVVITPNPVQAPTHIRVTR